MPSKLLERPNDLHEFRPLLTEIEERPTSPLGRLMVWVLLGVFASAIAWLCLAEIDIVVIARGKAIPDGYVKVLQPLETGVVSAIKVKEGQYVHRGDVLIEIDPSSTQPELQASLQQLALARSEIARLRSTVDGTEFHHGSSTQRQLHASSNESLDRQLAAKDKEQESLKEQIEQERTKIAQNNKLLTVAQERLTRYEQVSDILPKTELEDAHNQVVALNADIEQSNHKIGELNQSIDRVSHEKEQLRQSFKTDNLTDLVERERAITDLSAKRDELAFKNKKQRLLAPVDGVVEELFIHTVGGVITPAEKVLSIMPDHTQLVIETEVSNDDIGFVSQSLPAFFKVDTFDFQKYGMMEGTVKLVSKDSHLDQEQKSASKFYRVLIKPTKSQLIVDGRKEMLTTGMTGTAEIRVGKRKVIEFFVYPLLRGLHNGMGVR